MAKLKAFVVGPYPSLWMRNIDGHMARVVHLAQPDIVRYTLDADDEEHTCSYAEWIRFPVWTGVVEPGQNEE